MMRRSQKSSRSEVPHTKFSASCTFFYLCHFYRLASTLYFFKSFAFSMALLGGQHQPIVERVKGKDGDCMAFWSRFYGANGGSW